MSEAMLVLPRVPAVLPRLVLGLAAIVFALRAPVALVPLLVLGAGFVLLGGRDAAALRAAGWISAMTLALTLAVTPWLAQLAVRGTPDALSVAEAYRIAAALAVRLAAAAIVGVALVLALPPRTWFVALRRAPRLAVLLAVTFRQVPETAADVARLRRVQRARGLLAGRHRWRPVVILVPLISRSLERADRLARALVVAGWGSGKARPLLVARYRVRDAGLLVLAALLATLPFLWP